MYLIVGLGNPGRRYEGTRHNVGFEAAALLARRNAGGPPKRNFQGEVVDATIDGQRSLLLCPHTYMNLSGGSVLAARDFYKVPDEQILIVCDDINLPLGKIRLRGGGSSGGQKGLADVIRRLGTDQIARLRIGVGQPPPPMDSADYVLARFARGQQSEKNEAIANAAEAAELWVRQGLEPAMNRFN